MGPVLSIAVTLAADGQLNLKAEGPLSDNAALVAWLVRSAETAVLNGAAQAALRETASPIAVARALPPLPPNGLLRR